MDFTRRFPRIWPAAAALLLLATACQAPIENRGVTAVQFEDAYIPAGMQLRSDTHQSHSVEVREASYRQGHFEYTGNDPVDEVCEDLLRRMPKNGWRLVEDSGATNNRLLRFERQPYVTEYRVSRDQSTTRMVVDYRTEQPQER